MKKQKSKKSKVKATEIKDYDNQDVSSWIDVDSPLSLKDLGVQLPPTPTTQVISIRLPTSLLNQLRAIGSENDIPYQAYIKMILADSVRKFLKKAA